MATAGKDLSEFNRQALPSSAHFRVGIVVSRWNEEITGALLRGAREVLDAAGVPRERIHQLEVPGAFELPLAARWLLEQGGCDGVIAIGSVIRGETPHFEFVCSACAQGIMDVGLTTGKPAIFCVLTDDNLAQAQDRSGGKHGNKGVDCAVACLEMIAAREGLQGNHQK
jgi:6,7-dimethyl-8-ribityllumazine synthase